MRVIRSIAAVAAGYAFMACTVVVGTIVATALFIPGGLSSAVSGTPPVALPPMYLAANLVSSGIGAVLGGWLAARIGAAAPLAHAVALAALVVTLSIATVVAGASGPQPSWYALVVGVVGVAGVLAGGALRAAAASREQTNPSAGSTS